MKVQLHTKNDDLQANSVQKHAFKRRSAKLFGLEFRI